MVRDTIASPNNAGPVPLGEDVGSEVGLRVRIRLPPAKSLRTIGPLRLGPPPLAHFTFALVVPRASDDRILSSEPKIYDSLPARACRARRPASGSARHTRWWQSTTTARQDGVGMDHACFLSEQVGSPEFG